MCARRHARARARVALARLKYGRQRCRRDATRALRIAACAATRDDRVRTNCAARPEPSYIVAYYAFEISPGDRYESYMHARQMMADSILAPPDGAYRLPACFALDDSSGRAEFGSPNGQIIFSPAAFPFNVSMTRLFRDAAPFTRATRCRIFSYPDRRARIFRIYDLSAVHSSSRRDRRLSRRSHRRFFQLVETAARIRPRAYAIGCIIRLVKPINDSLVSDAS